MSLFRSNPGHPKVSGFRPCLEVLEDRAVPAVIGNLVDVNPAGAAAGATLVLVSTGSEQITIEDNGTANPGNVRWRGASDPVGMWHSFGNAQIWKTQLTCDSLNDNVTYNLTGNLAPGRYRQVEASLGAGSDTFKANVIDRTFTAPAAGGTTGLQIYVNGQNGNDAIQLYASGTLGKRTTLGWAVSGGIGRDWIGVNEAKNPTRPDLERTTDGRALSENRSNVLRLNIDEGSVVNETPTPVGGGMFWTNMNGNAGSDDIRLFYRGRLNGSLAFGLDGSDWRGAGIDDGDDILADITLFDTSFGVVGNVVDGRESWMSGGSSGFDRMAYLIRWVTPSGNASTHLHGEVRASILDARNALGHEVWFAQHGPTA